MKNSILLASLFVLSACSMGETHSDEEDEESVTPPQAVSQAFQENFKSSSGVQWELEDGMYEVEFAMNDRNMSATFDDKGVLVETETEIPRGELPQSIIVYVRDHYENAEIRNTEKVEKAGEPLTFEVAVNKKSLLFDRDGNFVEEESD